MMTRYLTGLLLVMALGLSYIIIQLTSPGLPPQVSVPTGVDNMFEHIILTTQEDDQFTLQTAKKNCTKLIQCKSYQALFTKYLNFKSALASQQPELSHLPLHELLKELLKLQSDYFTDHEISLLFDDDNQWQNYTIEKIEINLDTSINAELKQQLLVNLEASQPEHIITALKPSNDLKALNTLFSKALIEQNYNELAGEFGDAAATRLITLQNQRKQWLLLSERLVNKISEIKKDLTPSQAKKSITQLLDTHLTALQKRRFLALYPQT